MKSSGVNSGAGGLIGYLNVSKKVDIQGGENGHNITAKVYSDSNSGGLIGNLEANGKTYISNYSVGGSIKNESSKDSNGAGGFIGRVNNSAKDVVGNKLGRLYIYNEEDFAVKNNKSSATVESNQKAGGIIGSVSNTEAIISIGLGDEGKGSTIKLSQTVSSSTYAGGVIGSVGGNCDNTKLTILNIEMLGGVYGATSGGVIGHIDIEGGENKILIGGDSVGGDVSITGHIGNANTHTSGGVVGHIENFASNILEYGTIYVGGKNPEMDTVIIMSSKYLGGVVGRVKNPSVLSSTSSITLHRVQYSINNEQTAQYAKWVHTENGMQVNELKTITSYWSYETDENGKKVISNEPFHQYVSWIWLSCPVLHCSKFPVLPLPQVPSRSELRHL